MKLTRACDLLAKMMIFSNLLRINILNTIKVIRPSRLCRLKSRGLSDALRIFLFGRLILFKVKKAIIHHKEVTIMNTI